MKELDFSIRKLGEPEIDSPLDEVDFEKDDTRVAYNSCVGNLEEECKEKGTFTGFEIAGPRKKIFHNPYNSRAAIVTAGGLCPGLNDVIKSVYNALSQRYKIPEVLGIPYGFRGLIPSYGYFPIKLTHALVDNIHTQGGTILGSSRGNQDILAMIDYLMTMNINMLFCIGGDGTLHCAHYMAEEMLKRHLPISVIGIPKTIDNDIDFIDRAFGFETAVYQTNSVINSAHDEAMGAPNGVGLVKVMGRDSGFIAAYACLANTSANYCLIPEEPFKLDGPNGFLPHLFQRLQQKRHAVIIVSEGAGQNLIDDKSVVKDASGNVLHKDIGVFLKHQINHYAREHNLEVNVKYFDPSYMIRSCPALGTDAVYCLQLAQHAVHAAMSGRTDMVVGFWNNEFVHTPINVTIQKRKKIDTRGHLWRCVRDALQQPVFE